MRFLPPAVVFATLFCVTCGGCSSETSSPGQRAREQRRSTGEASVSSTAARD